MVWESAWARSLTCLRAQGAVYNAGQTLRGRRTLGFSLRVRRGPGTILSKELR